MKAAANPLETDLQTQVSILQSESVLKQVIAKLDLGDETGLAEKDKGRLSAWRKALHLPESKPAATVDDILPLVAGNLKVRAQANTRLVEILYDSTDPRPGRRHRQHPDRRVHPPEPRIPLANHPEDRRVAHRADGRRPHQAREIRTSSSRPMPAPRACCSPRRRTTSPKRSCASSSRNSPRPRPIASPRSPNTSWPPPHPPIRFPKCSTMPPSRTTRSSSPICAASLPNSPLP